MTVELECGRVFEDDCSSEDTPPCIVVDSLSRRLAAAERERDALRAWARDALPIVNRCGRGDVATALVDSARALLAGKEKGKDDE